MLREPAPTLVEQLGPGPALVLALALGALAAALVRWL